MLEAGSKAPPFKLAASDGTTVSLKDFAGRKVVVYFYPKDNTSGCSREAEAFRDAHKDLARRNAVVLGVSKDSIESHCRFRDKFHLNFLLLSDPDGSTIEKYGAWGEKNMYGRKLMGIIRSTVIVDEGGRVARVFPKVKVDGHVAQVLAALAEG